MNVCHFPTGVRTSSKTFDSDDNDNHNHNEYDELKWEIFANIFEFISSLGLNFSLTARANPKWVFCSQESGEEKKMKDEAEWRRKKGLHNNFCKWKFGERKLHSFFESFRLTGTNFSIRKHVRFNIPLFHYSYRSVTRSHLTSTMAQNEKKKKRKPNRLKMPVWSLKNPRVCVSLTKIG